ncbi:MAG: phage integrase SAM-like domain and Arm DNA-binding domain-containing protein, partial [Bacteroidia bacterium]
MSKDKKPVATANIGIDLRADKLKKDGTYPVGIRVVHDRRNRFYSIGRTLTPDAFKLFTDGSKKKEVKEFKKFADTFLKTANEAIESLGDDFTFERFKPIFKGEVKGLRNTDVFTYFQSHIDEIKEQGRFGTARNYQCGLDSLKTFRPRKIEFKELDVKFIEKYERWFLNRGNHTTLGIYLRPLRAVLRRA